jgi:hypothetical protein
MKKPKAPVHKIRPDVEYMPPEDYELPELKVIIAKDGPIEYCPHDQIKIYPHHRVIQCSHCGKSLDPFEYLLAVGKEENNQLTHVRYLKIQAKQYTEEVERLRLEVKNSRKKSVQSHDPKNILVFKVKIPFPRVYLYDSI